MNAWKRARLYLWRKKGRTFLMLGLLLLMSLSVLVGISFKESAEKELDRLRRSLASGFLLKVDTQNKLYHGVVDPGNGLPAHEDYVGPFITDEMIEKILGVDGVKDYTIQLVITVYPNLVLRPGLYAMYPEPDEYNSEEAQLIWRNTTDLYYLRDGELDRNFRTGALTIREGANIEEGDHFKVVISDWLAQKNHLSVGDTITLETKQGEYVFVGDPTKTLGEPVTAEIKGLFHANFTQSSEFTVESYLIENRIYADMDTAERLRKNVNEAGYQNAAENGYIKVEFLVDDPKELDAIMRRIEEREDIDLENMRMEADDADYRAVAEPYRQIRVFGMILLGLGICGMGVILFLAMRLWMQGRRREIGILYSIGIKKGKILWQMLTECLLVSAAAVLLSLLLSGPALGWCADAAERLSAPRAHEESYEAKIVEAWLFIERTSSDEVVLERTVSAEAAGYMALFVCGISCAGVLWSFGKASRFEPGKLLKSG